MGTVEKVLEIEEIPPGTVQCVEVAGVEIAVFNVNGEIYALENTCPHQGGPLCEGDLEGKSVICPWHGATFDVTTGRHLAGPPGTSDTKVYRVLVEGGSVRIELP